MIFYFTGTGNCLWTAEKLGEILEQPILNISSLQEQKNISVEDPVVGFVFPTYMNDIPWIAKEFLLRLHIPEKCYSFVVMTSNNGKSGKSADNVDRALCTNKAKLSASFNLQMPGNCIESSTEANEVRLNEAPERVKEIANQIQKKTVNYVSEGKKADKDYVTSSFFYGIHSLRRLTILNSFNITDACNGCGICEKICPTHNISIQNRKAVHSDHCAACYACLHWCPVHATLPKLLPLRHRKQYRHPGIEWKDLIRQS